MCEWSYHNVINVITHFNPPSPQVCFHLIPLLAYLTSLLPTSISSTPMLNLTSLYMNKQRHSSEAGRSLQGGGEVSGKWREPCHVCNQGTVHSCSTTTLCLVLKLLFITCLLSCTQGYESGGAVFQLSILHSTQGTQNLAQFSESHVPRFHHLQ